MVGGITQNRRKGKVVGCGRGREGEREEKMEVGYSHHRRTRLHVRSLPSATAASHFWSVLPLSLMRSTEAE